ncbi:MAG TPA: type II toxin-antitoxin system HicB family antitoxin [Stellaceae bacterium]|nr:type II toxin-antitoxin system HicB family antitoxin [Stellaceae bacterium]
MASKKGNRPLAYPAHLGAEEEGGFIVNVPDFPEGWSQGDDRAEALAQAADLLETMVANYMAEGWDLPDPSSARGRPLVWLAPLVTAKAELYRAMRRAGIGRDELARRLGIAPPEVDRLLSIHHASSLDQIAAGLAALGRRLVVTVEDA